MRLIGACVLNLWRLGLRAGAKWFAARLDSWLWAWAGHIAWRLYGSLVKEEAYLVFARYACFLGSVQIAEFIKGTQ